MLHDGPDRASYLKAAGHLIATAVKAAGGSGLALQLVANVLPNYGNKARQMRRSNNEQLWDEIARRCDVDILCGYVLNSFQREQQGHIYERICAMHSAIFPE